MAYPLPPTVWRWFWSLVVGVFVVMIVAFLPARAGGIETRSRIPLVVFVAVAIGFAILYGGLGAAPVGRALVGG